MVQRKYSAARITLCAVECSPNDAPGMIIHFARGRHLSQRTAAVLPFVFPFGKQLLMSFSCILFDDLLSLITFVLSAILISSLVLLFLLLFFLLCFVFVLCAVSWLCVPSPCCCWVSDWSFVPSLHTVCCFYLLVNI